MASVPAPLKPLPPLPRDEKAKVLEVFPLGADYFMLSLKSPAMAQSARPGQFAMLRATEGLLPLTRRPMSFWNVQREDGRIEFLMRAIGPATELFQRADTGATFSMLGPLGRGFDFVFPKNVRRVVLVGGGTGVAPLYFAARALKESSASRCIEDPRRSASGLAIHLFYGGRSCSHIHREEFARLGVDLRPVTEDGSLGERGLVTQPFQKFVERFQPECTVLSCGPTPMMRAVDEICRTREIPVQFALEEYMACGIGICLSCVVKTPDGRFLRTCREGPVLQGGTFLWA